MKISECMAKLTSIFHPSATRVILLVSRPVTWKDLEFMSMIFDEVIVESSTLPPLDDKSRPQPSNILLATRIHYREADLGQHKCEAGCAVWIQGRQGELLTFRQAEDAESVTLMLNKDPDSRLDPGSVEFRTMTYPKAGLVMAGGVKRVLARSLDATFVLIQEDDNLFRAIAAAAKAEIHHQLFGGLTGLES